MMRFTSLGTSCEFGFAQRVYGAETFDLFRWARTSVPILLHLLSDRLAGIGDATQIELRDREFDEWTAYHKKYGFDWHTFVLPERRMNREALHRRECARIAKLADIFINHLTLGDKILVIHGAELTQTAVRPLFEAIRAYGAAPLLFVTRDDSGSRVGTVELVDDGLLHGYIERFSIPQDMPATTDGGAWLAICQAALRALHVGNAAQPWQNASAEAAETAYDAASSWDVEALAMARQAVALCPPDAENHAHISWLLENEGDLDAASRELRIALHIKPDGSSYHRDLEDLERRKRRQELTALLDEAILSAIQIALRDRARAKRVVASLFPELYYFTPWAEVSRRLEHTASPMPAQREALLKEAVLPLLELCVVDEEFYATQNADLHNARENEGLDLTEHWRTHGYFEGRACRNEDLTSRHQVTTIVPSPR
jgi:tetratricopeptide (TPR) repeat protein